MDAGWVSHGLASSSAAAKAEGFEVNRIDLRDWDHFRKGCSATRSADQRNSSLQVPRSTVKVDMDPSQPIFRSLRFAP